MNHNHNMYAYNHNDVISSQLLELKRDARIHLAFILRDSPPYINVNQLYKINDLYTLRLLEKKYDVFLDKKFQVLLLLDCIEEVFDIREQIIVKINILKRKEKKICEIMF